MNKKYDTSYSPQKRNIHEKPKYKNWQNIKIIQITAFKATHIYPVSSFPPQPMNSKGSCLVLDLVWRRWEHHTLLVKYKSINSS